MLSMFVLLFIIQKIKNQNYKIYHLKWQFSFVVGFQSANENEFRGVGNLFISLSKSVGKVMKKFLKEFVRTLCNCIASYIYY